MSTHAELSPSKAHRWMRCPGSIALCRGIPDMSSAAADEGTLAHEIAATCIPNDLEVRKYLTARPLGEDNFPALQSYIDRVRNAAIGGELFIEVALDISWITGEEGAQGTADAVIYYPERKTLAVIDLKFGAGNVVYANYQDGDGLKLNPQLAMYAAAAVRKFEWIGPIDTIEMTIDQPRREHKSTAVASFESLMSAIDEIKSAAQATRDNPNKLVPGEAQCKWCPARATCKARADWHLNEFAREASLMDAHEVAAALKQVGDMRAWCDDVESLAMQRLTEDASSIPGWKIVAGRSVRKWKETAITFLRKYLPEAECYSMPTVIGIGVAEKKLGKDHPVFAEATVKPEGKPTLVEVTDPRPALTDKAGDFQPE
jgi:hypothetical protein